MARYKCAFGIFKQGREYIGKTVGIAGEHLTGTQMAAALAKALGGGLALATVASAGPALPTSSRMTLVGVVADAHSAGVALIAVDGKPAKPFRVGATVDGSLVLQSVGARKATLGADRDAVAPVVLELPALVR